MSTPPAHITTATTRIEESLNLIINQGIAWRRDCEVEGDPKLTGKAVCELPATEKHNSEIRCPLGILDIERCQIKRTTHGRK